MFSEGNGAPLVGCDSPLQIVMAVWRPSKEKEKWAPNSHYYLQRLSHPARGEPLPSKNSQIKKKIAKLPFLSKEGCHTQLDGHHCPLRTSN